MRRELRSTEPLGRVAQQRAVCVAKPTRAGGGGRTQVDLSTGVHPGGTGGIRTGVRLGADVAGSGDGISSGGLMQGA